MRVEPDYNLVHNNTLALPAKARAFVDAADTATLIDALDWSRAEGLACLPLGEGSNVVFAGDLDALVVRVHHRGIERLEEDERSVCLRVQAGESWHPFVRWALQQQYFGLENLALIPGTVGAAPIQNIGAYGVELAEFVERVHAFDSTSGKAFSLDAAECAFGYRDSIFKGDLRDVAVITAVDFRLSRTPHPRAHYPALAGWLEEGGVEAVTPQAVYDAVVAIRSSRLPDPAREPNVGSFFKNPVLSQTRADALQSAYPDMPHFVAGPGEVKVPAAWLIQQCGFKGERRGGVGVHPGHSLVLVNYGAKHGDEVLALAQAIQDAVRQRFGLALEIEPRLYGVAGSTP